MKLAFPSSPSGPLLFWGLKPHTLTRAESVSPTSSWALSSFLSTSSCGVFPSWNIPARPLCLGNSYVSARSQLTGCFPGGASRISLVYIRVLSTAQCHHGKPLPAHFSGSFISLWDCWESIPCLHVTSVCLAPSPVPGWHVVGAQ